MKPKDLTLKRIELSNGSSRLIPDYSQGRPWLIYVDSTYEGPVPGCYYKLYPMDRSFNHVYSRWQLWLPLKAKYELNMQWWSVLKFLRNKGLIHSSAPMYTLTRFRDLRLGKSK